MTLDQETQILAEIKILMDAISILIQDFDQESLVHIIDKIDNNNYKTIINAIVKHIKLIGENPDMLLVAKKCYKEEDLKNVPNVLQNLKDVFDVFDIAAASFKVGQESEKLHGNLEQLISDESEQRKAIGNELNTATTELARVNLGGIVAVEDNQGAIASINAVLAKKSLEDQEKEGRTGVSGQEKTDLEAIINAQKELASINAALAKKSLEDQEPEGRTGVSGQEKTEAAQRIQLAWRKAITFREEKIIELKEKCELLSMADRAIQEKFEEKNSQIIDLKSKLTQDQLALFNEEFSKYSINVQESIEATVEEANDKKSYENPKIKELQEIILLLSDSDRNSQKQLEVYESQIISLKAKLR